MTFSRRFTTSHATIRFRRGERVIAFTEHAEHTSALFTFSGSSLALPTARQPVVLTTPRVTPQRHYHAFVYLLL
jgi:hypothetical protein